jgi:putative transposase
LREVREGAIFELVQTGLRQSECAAITLLEGLRTAVGAPQRIAVDNGAEFISQALDAWAYRNGVQLEFSRPGKPTDNAIAESFNCHLRAECLDCHWFASLEEVRQTIEPSRIDDNTERPHRALGQATPAA